MTQRLIKLFSSLRFTLFLILSLAVVFLLGLWIPQKGLLRKDLYLQWKAASPALVSFLDALGFTGIYTSPITLTLWVLFFLNLSLVMWQRISVIKKRISFSGADPGASAALPAFPFRASIEIPLNYGLESVPAVMKKNGYRFYGTSKHFKAVKNRFSPLATLLFHLSFFLILLGGVVTVYTRFSGTLDLAEGEAFHGEMKRYNASPRMPKIGSAPDARFVIVNIKPEVEKGTPTGLTVIIRDGENKLHTAEINRPYKTDSASFVIKDLGVAPLVILHDKKDRELDGAYVKLNVLRGNQDVFVMSGLEFTADFFPDYFIKDGAAGTRSEETKNPAFQLYIQKDKKFLARKIIQPGEYTSFGDYRLSLPGMVYWVRFYVVKERGLWLVYAGFGIATLALIWRLVLYRREVVGSLVVESGTAVLNLAGRAEFYKALFEDEFEKLTRRIRDIANKV